MIRSPLLLLPACGAADLAAPGPTEADLRDAIAGYAAWDHAPSWPGVEAGDGTHGPYVQIWWNDVALAALDAGDPALPAGAALVKEAYADADGAELVAVTAMWKDEDWTWARIEPDDTMSVFGQPDACTSCHDAGVDGVLSEAW